MTKPSMLAYQWFQQALNLQDDEEIYIPAPSRAAQKTLVRDIKKVTLEYENVDKVRASSIGVRGVFEEGKMWVKIYIQITSSLVGFKRRDGGKMERIILPQPGERRRKVNLMLQDGYSNKEIIQNMQLSRIEQEQYLDTSVAGSDE